MLSVLFAAWSASAQAALRIADDGTSRYTVVQSDRATEPERFAARELTNFLSRVTGAAFPIVAETSVSGDGPRIYVGWTDYAAGQGIDAAELAEEEWGIRTVGANLVLTGGRPRGTMYAVYEFLEDYVGCHWLDLRTEVVPSRPTLQVGALDIRDKPWFWIRNPHSPTGTPDDKWRFMIRNKNYRYDMGGRRDFFPEGAFYRLDGSPHVGHSFSYFVNAADWFETHPEYFSLGRDGKRLPAYDEAGPGQLCLTNPDVRQLTLDKLRAYIAKDRAEAADKGCPPPRVYMIGQNDKYDAHCQCTGCQAIAQREGSESGPLIDFMNYIGERIEPEYPDIVLKTFAYNQTEIPPKTIRPRDNVLIGWCDVYSKVDLVRPLEHPFNVDHYEEITAWGKIAPTLGIGDDYWTSLSYYSLFPTPYCIIQSITSDLKLFADVGCRTFFAEAAEYCEAGQQFVGLRHWLAYQLLVDPYQPPAPLIKIYMNGCYGAASDKMNAYLAYLEKRIDADAQFKMTRDAPHKLAYLDLPFFVTSQKIFDAAEACVAPDGPQTAAIREERFILDGALLFLWPWLERGLPPGEAMPFDKESVIARYEDEWRSFTRRRYSRFYTHDKNSLNTDGKLLDRMVTLFRDPKLPERFRDLQPREVADFNWLTFSQIRPRQKFVPDDDAVGGMTATFTQRSSIQAAEEGGDKPEASAERQHRKPLTFGVTDGPTITLTPEEIPRDGAYHLHEIGRITVKPNTMVWALEGKRLGVTVDRVYVPGAADPRVNEWKAYISLKVQGPAYVEGSTEPDGAWMDRVLLVRPRADEPPSAEYLRYKEEQEKRAAFIPSVRVPALPDGAVGDPRNVQWGRAVNIGKWWMLNGGPTARPIEVVAAHDRTYLYVRLREELDPTSLVEHPDICGGDDWEFLFARARGVEPYRQLAISPAGKSVEYAYGEAPWKSGARVAADTADGAWTVWLAFPLDRLVSGGVKPGQAFYMNILRGGTENLVWSPTFEGSFHALGQLGEVVLE